MKSYATEPMKTTVHTKPGKAKLRHVQIEPADNGYTVHTSHHEDYNGPMNAPKKPKVFEKKHGHEMLKHVARKLGIRANITPMAENESAAEDAGEPGEE